MIQTDFVIHTGETKSGLPPLPTGNPLFTIVIDSLPSWNDIIYLMPKPRAGVIRAERAKGYKMGLAIGRKLNIPIVIKEVKNSWSVRGSRKQALKGFISEYSLFCLLKVWRERGIKDPAKPNKKRDVYNPAIKAIVDGLGDADLWADDSEIYHKDFWIHYAGVADTPRMEIKFYSLEEASNE